MISDNSPIQKEELLNVFKEKIYEISRLASANVWENLNKEETDIKSEDGTHISIAPMHMRDDHNFNDTKILEKFNHIIDKEYIEMEDIVQLCKEVYLYIIRMGYINYERYYLDNDYMRLRTSARTPVIFNHEFIYNNSELYQQLFSQSESIDLTPSLNHPVTDTSILYEFLNKSVQYALSKNKVTYDINISDCHADCYGDSCHNYKDSCKDSSCKGGDGICDFHGDCNCWVGGGNYDQCYDGQ